MPLDTSIPLQARFSPINYEIPQPINTLMSAMKIKQLGQENQLNALKMQEYERARTEEEGLRNYLSGGREMGAADLSSPDTRTNLLRYGKTGVAYAKALTEQETAALTQKETQFKVQKARKDFVAQAQRDTSQNPSDANITAYKEDLMANPLFTEAEKAQMAAGADRILAMPVNERKAFMASQGASASELKPAISQVNRSGQTDVISTPAFGGAPTTLGNFSDVPLPANVQAQKIQIAQQSRPPRAEAAPRTQQITLSDGSLGIVNMDTGVITPSTMAGAPVKGKPSAFAEKTAAQKVQMGKDLGFAITQLSDITKDGGLIDQSTGSGAGRLADIGAGFVGKATPGAIAIGKIAPVADLVLKMVPRFEGPQSNKDTQSYKEAAGQLADPTLPTAIRKEAGKTVLRLMQERKNQFVTNDMATGGVAPAQIAPPAGFTPDQ
jgi:hypothetical protein